jgi:hypothetical protein
MGNLKDYDVQIVFDQFIIFTAVDAHDEDEAKRVAWQKLTQDEALNLQVHVPIEYKVEWQGEYNY